MLVSERLILQRLDDPVHGRIQHPFRIPAPVTLLRETEGDGDGLVVDLYFWSTGVAAGTNALNPERALPKKGAQFALMISKQMT